MVSSEISLYRSIQESCIEVRAEEGEVKPKDISARFMFGEKFQGYNGHFPGNPVLPAIVQLAAVRHAAETVLQSKLAVIGYERIKFRGVITPGEDTVVIIRLDQAGAQWIADFSIVNDREESVADGKCMYSMPINP